MTAISGDMDSAWRDLEQARAKYKSAEIDLAVARADLSFAERQFHTIWGKALCNPAKALPRHDGNGGAA